MPRHFPVGKIKIEMRRLTPRLVRVVWKDVQEDDCVDLAAQMSFYFVMSLFPFLVVIGALVGRLPSSNLWPDMVQWLTYYLPRGSRRLVIETIFDLTTFRNQFFSYGLAATMWIASSGFVSLMESLSLAYGCKETRGFWKKRIIAMGATIIGAVFSIMSFGLLTFGHEVAEALDPHLQIFMPFPFPWQLVRWSVTLMFVLLGLDLINYFLPNVKHPWRWLTPGTVFVALSLVGTMTGFGYYLRHFGDYPRFYGAMAGFVILVTCIYIASLILLIGAEIDSTLENLRHPEALP